MKNSLLVILGKTIQRVSKLFGNNGAALPGFVIEKLSSSFLPTMLKQLPKGVVVVTGTNGKTTTTKMLSKIAHDSGMRVLTNKTGSNFVRGIISYVVKHATISGHLPYDIAIIELDEAYAVKFVNTVKPRGVVVLNITRDQLDRFGEIDTTLKLIQRVVDQATDFVVVNDDDSKLRKLELKPNLKKFYFGVAPNLRKMFPSDDDLYLRKKIIEAMKQRTVELVADSPYQVKISGVKHSLKLKSLGAYNAQNAVAALAAWRAIDGSDNITEPLNSLAQVDPAFGRGEEINWRDRKIILQLVKNPGGFRQSIKIVNQVKPKMVAILVNDDYADGRDVSWLWDVDFTVLKTVPTICGGDRGYDMALRLDYDSVESKVYSSLPKLLKAIQDKTPPHASVVVFSTYTAMLALRKLLKKQGEVKEI